MKIGIIGSGYIGATAARLWARAVGVEEAARFGEVVLVAVPFGRYRELRAEAFDGKIVIDANNYYPERDGRFAELDKGEVTSSELLASHLKGARVVKGFNTIWFEHLGQQGDTNLPVEERRAIFIAGDDDEPKRTVARLVEEIGFAAVDTGSLKDGGRRQQVGTPVYNKELSAREAREVLATA